MNELMTVLKQIDPNYDKLTYIWNYDKNTAMILLKLRPNLNLKYTWILLDYIKKAFKVDILCHKERSNFFWIKESSQK